MKTLLPALAGAALAAAPVSAAAAQDWILDPEASSVTFELSVYGNAVRGAFSDVSADITLDPEALDAASIAAVVRTGSGDVGDRDYQSAMDGESGLDPDAHPEARFVSDTIRATADGYEAEGEITIKGETRPLTLPFTLSISDGRAVAEGSFTLDRTAFGVESSSWSNVSEQVTVRVRVEADAAG